MTSAAIDIATLPSLERFDSQLLDLFKSTELAGPGQGWATLATTADQMPDMHDRMRVLQPPLSKVFSLDQHDVPFGLSLDQLQGVRRTQQQPDALLAAGNACIREASQPHLAAASAFASAAATGFPTGATPHTHQLATAGAGAGGRTEDLGHSGGGLEGLLRQAPKADGGTFAAAAAALAADSRGSSQSPAAAAGCKRGRRGGGGGSRRAAAAAVAAAAAAAAATGTSESGDDNDDGSDSDSDGDGGSRPQRRRARRGGAGPSSHHHAVNAADLDMGITPDMDDATRARVRREKNRLAARKCRAKKLKFMEDVKATMEDLMRKNGEYRRQVATWHDMFNREVRLREALKSVIAAMWARSAGQGGAGPGGCCASCGGAAGGASALMGYSASDIIFGLESGTMDVGYLLRELAPGGAVPPNMAAFNATTSAAAGSAFGTAPGGGGLVLPPPPPVLNAQLSNVSTLTSDGAAAAGTHLAPSALLAAAVAASAGAAAPVVPAPGGTGGTGAPDVGLRASVAAVTAAAAADASPRAVDAMDASLVWNCHAPPVAM